MSVSEQSKAINHHSNRMTDMIFLSSFQMFLVQNARNIQKSVSNWGRDLIIVSIQLLVQGQYKRDLRRVNSSHSKLFECYFTV